MLPRFLICFTLVLSSPFLFGQSSQDSTSQTSGPLKSKKIFYGEPGKAALYSLILPGAGQVYNKRIWKVPLVYALEGAAIYFLLDNTKLYNKWNTCYVGIVEGSSVPLECGSVEDSSTAFRLRNTARTNKELSYIFVGLAHLLQVVDAFVDRHLINFDTSEDLSWNSYEMILMEPDMKLFSINIPLNSHSKRIPSRKPTR